MRVHLLSAHACVVLIQATSLAQTPPVSTTVHCEELNRFVDASTPIQGHPYWALVLNARSDYWTILTDQTQFGSAGWVRGTVLGFYDSSGHLLAQNEFYSNTPFSVLAFGSIWNPDLPGSPTMLAIGENYYLGIAGRSSVFTEGFNCTMSSDSGRFVAFSQPTPGAGVAMLLGSGVFLRRKR